MRIVTVSMWKPTEKMPLIAACKRVRTKETRDKVSTSSYADYLLRHGRISKTQCDQTKTWPRPSFQIIDLCQFCLNTQTRWLGIEIKPPRFRYDRKYKENLAAHYNRTSPAEYAFMCKDCFQLAQWHVKHKWNVITHLWHCMPQVPRDLWRYIAELCWDTDC